MINISQIRKFDSVNGVGIGVSVFCSGCNKRCKNCFNKELQNFSVGDHLNDQKINEIVSYLKNIHVNHLSLLGGDFLDQDLDDVRLFLNIIKKEVPNKLIWLWTGYVYQEMLNSDNYIDKLRCEIINDFIDYLVDGPFIESLSSKRIILRGSENQIIWKKDPISKKLVEDSELMNFRL